MAPVRAALRPRDRADDLRDCVDSWGFWKNLVVRPVKNGDARLKHTATEKTAAVPVAEAESTKVLPRGAVRHRGESLEKPPGHHRDGFPHYIRVL